MGLPETPRRLPAMTAPVGVATVLFADVLFHVALPILAFVVPDVIGLGLDDHPHRGRFLVGLTLLCLAIVVSSILSGRLRARAMNWRRRLGLLQVIAVLWAGSPFAAPWLQALVVVWTGVVWVALIQLQRGISRVVVEATGAESLHDFE